MARAKVITERDVRRAANGGARELDATGAVITPSARDAAARSGVTLKGSKRAIAQRDVLSADAGSQPAASPVAARSIAVGADHGGVALRDAIAARLREIGHTSRTTARRGRRRGLPRLRDRRRAGGRERRRTGRHHGRRRGYRKLHGGEQGAWRPRRDVL